MTVTVESAPHALNLKRSIVSGGIALAVVLAVSAAFFPRAGVFTGIAVGWVLGAANYAALIRLMRTLLAPGGKKALAGILLALKMLVLVALVFLVLRHLSVNGIAVAFGFTSFLAGAAISSMVLPAGSRTR